MVATNAEVNNYIHVHKLILCTITEGLNIGSSESCMAVHVMNKYIILTFYESVQGKYYTALYLGINEPPYHIIHIPLNIQFALQFKYIGVTHGMVAKVFSLVIVLHVWYRTVCQE